VGFFILSAFVVLLSASAQEARWVQMSEQVQQLRKEGRIAQAIPLAQQTVQVAQATFGPNDRHVGLSLDELGVLLSDQDDFAGAESSLRRALVIFQKTSGPQSKDAGAKPLLSLAKLYHDHGRWGQAEGAFHDALTAAVQSYGQNDPHVGDVLESGGSLLIDEGKLMDAARVLRGAIAIYQNAGPAYRASLATALSIAAWDCESARDYKTAESLYQQSIEINEKVLGRPPILVSPSISLASATSTKTSSDTRTPSRRTCEGWESWSTRSAPEIPTLSKPRRMSPSSITPGTSPNAPVPGSTNTLGIAWRSGGPTPRP
jgi:tetratricopeptide (TPR) repeat protein